jgi:hypothetical protein
MTLSTADRLTGQLYHLPSIVGKLGISIANAQKALNADYLENIRQLLVMIDGILTGKRHSPAHSPTTARGRPR